MNTLKLLMEVFCLLLACCTINAAETSTSASFRQFLETTLQKYDTWLGTAEKADPTPPIKFGYGWGSSIYKNLFDIYYTIGYQEMVGFVKEVDERKIDYIYVDLIDLHFSIGLTTKGNITFQGNYTAEGDVNTGVELEGSGTWSVFCTSVTDVYNFTFAIKDGYVDIYSRDRQSMLTILEIDEFKTQFEGLWDDGAGGFAPDIRNQMSLEIQSENEEWFDGHPTGTLMFRFLNETFQDTPLAEIIAVEEEEESEQSKSNLAQTNSTLKVTIIETIANNETSTSAQFRNFLEETMSSYNTWLSTAEEADPTPPIQIGWGFDWISKNLFSLTYEIEYQEMVGYVKQVEQRQIDYIYVNLIDLHFSIGITTKGSITYQGNYTANGKIATDHELAGSGVWNVTCASISDVYNFTFAITKEGYVDIAQRSPTVSTRLEIDDKQTYFEGLWDDGADGFAQEIRKQLGIEIQEQNEKWMTGHPTGTLLLRFLNETFQNTPLTDIIDIVIPTDPTSTTTSTTEVTPTETTTQPPEVVSDPTELTSAIPDETTPTPQVTNQTPEPTTVASSTEQKQTQTENISPTSTESHGNYLKAFSKLTTLCLYMCLILFS